MRKTTANKKNARTARASSDSLVLNLEVLCFVGSSVGGGPNISLNRYRQTYKDSATIQRPFFCNIEKLF